MDTRSNKENDEPVVVVAGRYASSQETGLCLAAATMNRGERALVYIEQPSYGYGSVGSFSFPCVPPNSRLVYELEMVNWESIDEGDNDADRGSLLFEERLERAERRRLAGNELFKEGRYKDALAKYALALSYMDEDFMYQLEGHYLDKAEAVKLRVHLNMAAAQLKTGDYNTAIYNCGQVLNMDNKNVKALFRRARAQHKLGRTTEARQDLEAALKIDPNDPELKRELAAVKATLKEEEKASAALYRGLIKPSTSAKAAGASDAASAAATPTAQAAASTSTAGGRQDATAPNQATKRSISAGSGKSTPTAAVATAKSQAAEQRRAMPAAKSQVGAALLLLWSWLLLYVTRVTALFQKKKRPVVRKGTRTEGALLWRSVQNSVEHQPGVKHVYTTAARGHSVAALAVGTGKQKWVFPKPPGVFSRRDPLGLPADATLANPQETQAPLNASTDAAARRRASSRFRALSAASPSADGAPEPWLVLVSTQNPSNRLYAVVEETGALQWSLTLAEGTNITGITLPEELPTLALIWVTSSSEEEGGTYGACVAVDVANGTTRWGTGPLAGGPPSLALATPSVLVLHGAPDADLVETLYGLHAATGAVVWTKACSGGCTVLQVTDHTAVIASYGFTVSELEAIDLQSGKVLWRGVESSSEPALACSGAVVAHRHLFFGCPCSQDEDGDGQDAQLARQKGQVVTAAAAAVAAAAGAQPRPGRVGASARLRALTSRWEEVAAGEAQGTAPGSTVSEAAPARAAAAADGAAPAGRGHRDPDDRAAQRLCGFAVSTDSGEAVWRSRLEDDNSTFPVAAGAGGLLPLVVGEVVVLATQRAVHALDRSSGRRLWSFKLPAGQELKAWDILDEEDSIVVVRTSGAPPADSYLYGLDLAHGELRVNVSLPSSYGPTDSPSRPYDLRDGVAYLDACSGSRCCLAGIDLLEASASAAREEGEGGSKGHGSGSGSGAAMAGVARSLRRRLVWALGAAPDAALLLAAGIPFPHSADGNGGGGEGVDGDGGDAGGRTFTYCFDVAAACRASAARSLGRDIVYALLAVQMVVLVVGLGSVVVWRLCCRARYAPYTRLNALPVMEVAQHDVASEEADDEDGYDSGGEGAGAAGVAVPVVEVEVAAGRAACEAGRRDAAAATGQ
ncbi:hypothetical protein GPECTOR_69g410 [Gonium pectorale]|uniref:peptidylprolyl isomerase n=1 Tax=Gonium pectorale TaxID=33097 RepID=A0A150G391_GONPE|nr:hypothetical protein GPECTOR_69g410 [Gonium pectorale]|eukprot:KXZ44317.1 hypothetical protein GPECTOR_69g410 [Gonium pectorale]